MVFLELVACSRCLVSVCRKRMYRFVFIPFCGLFLLPHRCFSRSRVHRSGFAHICDINQDQRLLFCLFCEPAFGYHYWYILLITVPARERSLVLSLNGPIDHVAFDRPNWLCCDLCWNWSRCKWQRCNWPLIANDLVMSDHVVIDHVAIENYNIRLNIRLLLALMKWKVHEMLAFQE